MKDRRGDMIVGRGRMSGFDVKRMSARAGIKLSTMYKRIREPWTMTIDELASLDRAVHFTDDEILRLVRNK